MSARLAGAFMAGAVLGAGGLWLALPRPPPPDAPPRGESARMAPSCPPGPTLDISEIRAVVRQELAAATASPVRVVAGPPPAAPLPAPPAETPPESPPPKPPSPEYTDAQRLVEDSLARRTWSTEDRGRLQALMSRLSPTERESLMRQLIVAANRGELKVDVPGPLF